MNARHSKKTNKWGTPSEYVWLSRVALGGSIELDPMSSTAFNETVKAERIYTEEDSCFSHIWQAKRMFINPAGGLVKEAWKKTVAEYMSGNVLKVIWVGFSVEQLNLLADETAHPLDFSYLLTRKRISFIRHDGYEGAPGHANYVVGLGIPHDFFASVFRQKGRVGCGHLSVNTPKVNRLTLNLP